MQNLIMYVINQVIFPVLDSRKAYFAGIFFFRQTSYGRIFDRFDHFTSK